MVRSQAGGSESCNPEKLCRRNCVTDRKYDDDDDDDGGGGGWPLSRSGRLGEEKNLLPLTGFQPRIVQPVAYSADSLYQLPQPYDKLHTYQTCGKSDASATTASVGVFALSEATASTRAAKRASRAITMVQAWLYPLPRP